MHHARNAPPGYDIGVGKEKTITARRRQGRVTFGLVTMLACLLAVPVKPISAGVATAPAGGRAPRTAGLAAYGSLAAVSAVSSDEAWAVGTDTHVYPPQPLLLHWDGAAWRAVPSLQTKGHYTQVRGVADISPRDAWAVGDMDQAPLTLHWDGTAWRVVPNPALPRLSGYTLQAVTAVSDHDVWAVGTGYGGTVTLAEHWDGTHWSVVPTPSLGQSAELVQTQGRYSGGLAGVAAIAGRNVWSVGFAFEHTAPLIEHWDGAAWLPVPGPTEPGQARHVLAAIAAVAPTDLWAAGRLDAIYRRGGAKPLLLHWDGRRWTAVPGAPLPNDQGYSSLAGIAAVSTNDVWAVGSMGRAAAIPLVEHWNGARWQSIPGPALPKATGQPSYALTAVTAISTNDVWAVGAGGTGASQQPLIAHWDGARWRLVLGA